jgi:DNA replication ATP-dependent helicase Dna2
VGNFIRTGFRSSCSDFLLDRLRPKRKYPVFIDDLAKKLGKVSKISEYIKNCPLVAATCHQVMSNPLFAFQRFDRALIDEAGQLDEPSTLAAISLGNRFILCGDHQQLSPIVRSRESSKGPPETWGLDRSLFERLLLRGPSLAVSKLRIQYRMNDGIQDIVSRVFYSGMLKAAEEVANRKLSIEGDNLDMGGLGDVLDPDRPVIFVDTPSKGTGKTSPEEAQVASIITGELIRRGVGPESIGIITPYRAQQALIREYLTRIGFPTPGLIVNTVDRFQGGEREVIILSLSRSDNVTSFLADRKRLNVSLSRARSKLILIGRRSNLITHDLFKDILQDTHSASLCREYPDGRE